MEVDATAGATIATSPEARAAVAVERAPPAIGALGFAARAALGPLTVDGWRTVRPYGSLYARRDDHAGGWDVEPAVAGLRERDRVDRGRRGAAYSELGDQAGGDQGRYVIAPYPLDPFATAHLEPAVTPRADADADGDGDRRADRRADAAPPAATAVATPAPAVAATAGRGGCRVGALDEAAAGGQRVPSRCACAGDARQCRGDARVCAALTAAAQLRGRGGRAGDRPADALAPGAPLVRKSRVAA